LPRRPLPRWLLLPLTLLPIALPRRLRLLDAGLRLLNAGLRPLGIRLRLGSRLRRRKGWPRGLEAWLRGGLGQAGMLRLRLLR
jgi:hypothetical protein